MLKYPISYIDFEGNQKTRDFYFNLTRGEILKIHMSIPGGIDGFIERLNDEPSVSDVIEVFEKIVLASYGKRTTDNKYIKSKEISEEFSASDAYSELLIKFIENEDDFVNKFLQGVMNVTPEELKKLSETPELNTIKESLPADL